MINNVHFRIVLILFYRLSTRFNKALAWSQRTWQRRATTAVSRCTFGTLNAILLACAAFNVPTLQSGYSYNGPSGIDDGDLCKCNTVLYNLISACDACQGEPWIKCVDQLCLCLDSYRLTCLQLATLCGRPTAPPKKLRECKFCVVSTGTHAHLPPELPESRPSWHASTPLGLHRHICAYLPSVFHLSAQEISSIYRLVTAGMPRKHILMEVRNSATLFGYLYLSYLDPPEVTGTASIVPTSTTQASQSVTASASSSSSSALHHSSNTSAIAGGIVGGVVGAALISGIVLWIVLRLRRARSVPSAYMDFQSGEKEQPPPHLLVKGTPKLYVRVYSLTFILCPN